MINSVDPFTRLPALNAVKKQKFHSSQTEQDQFTAEIATKNTKSLTGTE